MLYKRVISGLLFLPVFYLVTWKLDPVYFTALVLVAAVLGQHEFYRMAKARGHRAERGRSACCSARWWSWTPTIRSVRGAGSTACCIVLLLILTARLFSPRPVEGALEDISVTLLGVFYVALLFSFQVAVRMIA